MRGAQPPADEWLDDAKVVFPSGSYLSTLPPEFEAEIRGLAVAKLRRLFLPICLLTRAAKARSRRTQQAEAVAPSEHLLKQASSALDGWPSGALHRLIARLLPVSYRVGETIVYKGEPCVTGLLFVGSGAVAFESGREATVKESPVFAWSPASVVMDETAMFRVVAESPVDCWRLGRACFFELLADDLFAATMAVAIRARRDSLHRHFPATPSLMRESVIFRTWPEHLLNYLVSRLEALTLPAGSVLLEQGAKTEKIYFVIRGTLAAADPPPGLPPEPDGGAGAAVPEPASVVGDVELITGGKLGSTVACGSICDIWVLHEPDLRFVLSDDLSRESQRLAFAQQYTWMQRDGASLLPFLLLNAPLLSRLLTAKPLCEAVVACFSPKIYHKRQIIASVTDVCDRVILLCKGTAAAVDTATGEVVQKLGGPRLLGETAVTSVCRWRYLIISSSALDCWEAKAAELRGVLAGCNALPVAGRPAGRGTPAEIDEQRLALWRELAAHLPSGSAYSGEDLLLPVERIDDLQKRAPFAATVACPGTLAPAAHARPKAARHELALDGMLPPAPPTRSPTARICAKYPGPPVQLSRNDFGLPMSKADWMRFVRQSADPLPPRRLLHLLAASRGEAGAGAAAYEAPPATSTSQLLERLHQTRTQAVPKRPPVMSCHAALVSALRSRKWKKSPPALRKPGATPAAAEVSAGGLSPAEDGKPRRAASGGRRPRPPPAVTAGAPSPSVTAQTWALRPFTPRDFRTLAANSCSASRWHRQRDLRPAVLNTTAGTVNTDCSPSAGVG
ncbi:hypothetical protein DIPPA_07874 [Diplonema papillatum]|nr:hypothetical protein DIPPA_35794 [Diplonema papillatum]KAJ9437758.1 hypothetical protein DIPPA_07874 [Diplonema papillatum]